MNEFELLIRLLDAVEAFLRRQITIGQLRQVAKEVRSALSNK